MTRRRRRIEERLRSLASVHGVRNAFLEYDPTGFERGHRWLLCANTRTGSKEFLCRNLEECEQALAELEHICRDEARLTDEECLATITRSLGRSARVMP